MASAQSPSSSPRLPSPPPIAEDQIGPTSPGVSLFEDSAKFPGINSIDTGVSRRIRPGTKAEDMAEGPPLVELQDIDSAFQLTEHLKALHYSHTHPPNTDSLQPITAEIAKQLTTPPPSVSKDIWLYELGRFLIQKTNAIIVALFADNPPCSSQTCPEMRASEWQYLCAVHDPPKSCAAIDYCCHTLDWAATVLTSSKMFPSRLGLGSGHVVGNDKVLQQQMKEIKNIFRRVYRIYAHAWFQHREMFWRVEGKTGLYIFFKMVCDEYGIIERENYTIPAAAEGLEPEPEPPSKEQTQQTPPSLLRRDQDAGLGVSEVAEEEEEGAELSGSHALTRGDTTKRHRHTMSDLTSSATNVIQEEAEEEDEQSQQPPLEPHPSLDRHATALKNLAGELDEGTETQKVQEEEDDGPAPSLPRSNTIKPMKEEAVADDADVTVVEVSAEDQHEIDGADEASVKVEETQEQPAAEGEDSGKMVGD